MRRPFRDSNIRVEQLNRGIVDNVAIFKTKVNSQNYITIPAQERETVGIGEGDTVKVYIARVGVASDILYRERNVFNQEVKRAGNVLVPSEVRGSLDIRSGDVVQIIAYKPRVFTGTAADPLKSILKQRTGGGGRRSRVDIEDGTAKYTASVPKFGQTSIPPAALEEFGLNIGDTVSKIEVINESMGEEFSTILRDVEIKSNGRFTIVKDERINLNLSPNDEVKVILTP